MAFNFPDAPTLNQQYGSYKWDGEKWIAYGTPDGPSDGLMYGRKNGVWNRAVDVVGDTMTGPLILTGSATAGGLTIYEPNAITVGAGGVDGAIRFGNTGTRYIYWNSLQFIVNGPISVQATNPSTSSTIGALTVAGGVGVSNGLNVGGASSIGDGVSSPISGRTLTLNSGGQPAFCFNATGSTAGNHVLGLLYDGGGAIGFPGIVIQNLDDTGGFVANSSVIWRDGALSLGGIGRPNGGAGGLIVASATPSTSPSTGALAVAGGVGVGGNLYVGQNIYPSGRMHYPNSSGAEWGDQTTAVIGTGNGASGGIIVYVNSTPTFSVINNHVDIPVTTPSSSPSTGALTVAGGVGIGDGLSVGTSMVIGAGISAGGQIATNSNFISNVKGSNFGNPAGTLSTGAVTVNDANFTLYNGGAVNWCGMGTDPNGDFWLRTGLSGTPVPALRINTAQTVAVQATTASTSTSTGALRVSGGMGVVGQVSAANFATFGSPSTTRTFDASGSTVSIANGASAYVVAGSGLLTITDTSTTGQTGCYLIGGPSSTRLAGGAAWDVPTTTPAAGKASVQYDGSTGYKIYNNIGTTVVFGVAFITTRITF